MQRVKRNEAEPFKVRRAKLVPIPPEAERTPLGRELMKIVAEIDLSDDPPLSEQDLERELKMRRGGFSGYGQ
jgi:hypothetical protein